MGKGFAAVTRANFGELGERRKLEAVSSTTVVPSVDVVTNGKHDLQELRQTCTGRNFGNGFVDDGQSLLSGSLSFFASRTKREGVETNVQVGDLTESLEILFGRSEIGIFTVIVEHGDFVRCWDDLGECFQ